jgi:hypothetical protein
MRHHRRLTAALVCGLTVLASGGDAADVLGTKPRYLVAGLSSVPNEQAIVTRIWAPGLDEGYVPQGITVAESAVLLSAYKSTDPKVGSGPCRVFRIDPVTGVSSAFFDLPADCGHAGGLAYLGNGALVVADTRRLYKIDMRRAFDDRTAQNALHATVRLAGALKGSFVDFDGTDLWVGVYDKEPGNSRIYRLPLTIFTEAASTPSITEERALSARAVPPESQGAAFDREGRLWISASSSRFGRLSRLDPKTGAVLASYEMMIGIEDIGFDAEGRLWSVSEAGSQRWSRWAATYPIVFQLDIAGLK